MEEEDFVGGIAEAMWNVHPITAMHKPWVHAMPSQQQVYIDLAVAASRFMREHIEDVISAGGSA